jgi:hypothetical protein
MLFGRGRSQEFHEVRNTATYPNVGSINTENHDSLFPLVARRKSYCMTWGAANAVLKKPLASQYDPRQLHYVALAAPGGNSYSRNAGIDLRSRGAMARPHQ